MLPESWEDNVYLKDMLSLSQQTNSSKCWMCAPIPSDARAGIMLQANPLNKTQFINDLTSYPTRKYSDSVKIHVPFPADFCLSRIRTASSTDLGVYHPCAQTIPVPITCPMNTSLLPVWEYNLCESFVAMYNWSKEENNISYALPNDWWVLCGTRAYRSLPMEWSGTCTLGKVTPMVLKLSEIPQHTKGHSPQYYTRTKREGSLSYDMPWYMIAIRALIPALGAGWNAYDIGQLNNWTVAMFNETADALTMINKQLGDLRTFSLHTRFAVDIMLASKGGVCALVGPACCVYVPDPQANISAIIYNMRSLINDNPISNYPESLNFSDIWAAMWSWLPGMGWLKNILSAVLMIVILLICLCCCIQCIPSLVTMVRSFLPSPKQNVMIITQTQAERQSLLTLPIEDNNSEMAEWIKDGKTTEEKTYMHVTSEGETEFVCQKTKTEEMWE